MLIKHAFIRRLPRRRHKCTLPVWLHLSPAARPLWPTQRFHNRMHSWIPPAGEQPHEFSSVCIMLLVFFPLCLSQYLVQANPVPRGRHEVLLDGVVKKCILVGAPYTHRRYVHQRCVKALPQLWERREEREALTMRTTVHLRSRLVYVVTVSLRSPPDQRLQWRACGRWLRSSCHWCICPEWPGVDTHRAHRQQKLMPSHHRPQTAWLWVWCARGSDPSRLVSSSCHWAKRSVDTTVPSLRMSLILLFCFLPDMSHFHCLSPSI